MELFPDYQAEKRFIPYIEMHEFEALLFSDASILANQIGIELTPIKKILDSYDNPEEINDNPDHAPSTRLNKLMNNYRKVAMGKKYQRQLVFKKFDHDALIFINGLAS